MKRDLIRRILPREEYGRLVGTPLADAVAWMGPETRVMVSEHQGAIVGCLALAPLWHVEGLWIDPAHRGRGRVFRHLLQSLGEQAAAVGAETVFPGAASDDMRQIVTGLGAVEIPVTFYALNVQKAKPCHHS